MSTSPYIHGLHEPGGEHLMADKPGWIVFTESIGHDPGNLSGADYSRWADAGFGVIVRLNNGYYPDGTIPHAESYPAFAKRCANFVAASKGCEHWIIGNEPNHAQERPQGFPISWEDYALCCVMCMSEIKLVQPGAQILAAAVAPWNTQTGDWMEYHRNMLLRTKPDGIALHAYTHGSDPALITSQETMDSHPGRFFHFQHVWQMLTEVAELGGTPLYITEANQGDAWLDENNGWVQEMYAEVDRWNQAFTYWPVRCATLYRWPDHDQWGIESKPNAQAAFREAIQIGYTWKKENGGNQMAKIYEDGFEGTFYFADDPYSGATKVSELECPIGPDGIRWAPFWVQGTEPGKNVRFEVKPKRKPQPEIHDGDQAIGIHTSSASHDGCIYRKLSVSAGAKVRLSAWVMGKSTDAQHALRIGIGGPNETDHRSENIVWSEWWADHMAGYQGTWKQLTVEAVSDAFAMTLWLHTKCDYAGNAAGHFDDILVEAEEGTQPPTPPPTDGTLQEHIAAVRDKLTRAENNVKAAQTKLDALEEYVNTQRRTCILVE